MEQTVTKEKKYLFSDAELLEIGAHLVDALDELSRVEIERKEIMSRYKEKIEAAKRTVGEFRSKLSQKYEYRSYDCEMRRDYERFVRVYTDINTGEVIAEEPFRPKDHQVEADLV